MPRQQHRTNLGLWEQAADAVGGTVDYQQGIKSSNWSTYHCCSAHRTGTVGYWYELLMHVNIKTLLNKNYMVHKSGAAEHQTYAFISKPCPSVTWPHLQFYASSKITPSFSHWSLVSASQKVKQSALHTIRMEWNRTTTTTWEKQAAIVQKPIHPIIDKK